MGLGSTTIYRDSAGVVRETPDQALADTSTAMLPAGDFTPEQAAMAKLPLPFRNLIRDPFVAGIAQQATTTQYPQTFLDAMAQKGCSSFRIINPNTCFIRFRGATGPNDKIQEGEGRLMAPGAVEVFSTQNPTYLSVIPVVRPGYPVVAADLVPVELNYGIGS